LLDLLDQIQQLDLTNPIVESSSDFVNFKGENIFVNGIILMFLFGDFQNSV